MWLAILSDQLPVIALVSRYLANKLIGRELLWMPRRFPHQVMPPGEIMRYYPAVGPAIPHIQADCSRVTHPFAGCPCGPP